MPKKIPSFNETPDPVEALIEAIHRLDDARALVQKLKDEKSTHPWTEMECHYLAELCTLFGVTL